MWKIARGGRIVGRGFAGGVGWLGDGVVTTDDGRAVLVEAVDSI